MSMGSAPKKWNLADVVDFEAILGEEGDVSVSPRERRDFAETLKGLSRKKREVQRRRGLRYWLERRREKEDAEAGHRVVFGIRFLALLSGVFSLLAGIGVMRALLFEIEIHARAYHLWLFLAATIGIQWVVILFGLFSYLFFRGKKFGWSPVKSLFAWLALSLSSGLRKPLWDRLRASTSSYSSVLSWRLARMMQGAAICFNVGLILGFLGCLWFFKVTFYWESTLAGVSGHQLYALTHGLSFPWSWSGVALPLEYGELEFDVLQKLVYSSEQGDQWLKFLTMVLLVWGLFPRVVFWLFALQGERRAFGRLDFQERRHRVLWRRLAQNERGALMEGPADGVVLLKVGGVEVDQKLLRGFLLRKVRVHVEEEYEAAVLDGTREEEALAAISKAPMGVVFLVEGWALSPKEMKMLYERVKSVGPECTLRFLVVGELQSGVPSSPDNEEYVQWERFVDGLKDPATEVLPYEELNPVSE